jgi:hypothetical protein
MLRFRAKRLAPEKRDSGEYRVVNRVKCSDAYLRPAIYRLIVQDKYILNSGTRTWDFAKLPFLMNAPEPSIKMNKGFTNYLSTVP